MNLKSIIFSFFIFCIFISDASCSSCKKTKGPSQKELNELTLIMNKYGNNSEGISAMHYAILKKDAKAVNLILKLGADPMAKDSGGKTCLYYACRSGSISLIKKFISLGNNDIEIMKTSVHGYGSSALGVAAASGHFEASKYLICSGLFKVRFLKEFFRVLITREAKNFTFDQKKDLIYFMIDQGLDVNNSPGCQKTLLEEYKNHFEYYPEMREFLISLGAK